MDKNNNERGTYLDSGFNRFLQRSIVSKPEVRTLRDVSKSSGAVRSINFDNVQVSGALADTIEVGKILIDGATGDGRIDGRDDNQNTVWRLGDVES